MAQRTASSDALANTEFLAREPRVVRLPEPGGQTAKPVHLSSEGPALGSVLPDAASQKSEEAIPIGEIVPLDSRATSTSSPEMCLRDQATDFIRPLELGVRANSDLDAQNWLDRYRDRLGAIGENSFSADEEPAPREIVPPWWDVPVRESSAAGKTPRAIGIDRLIEDALQFSSYISAISTEPQIRQTALVVERAEFDWRAYLNSTYRNVNEPVGNTLTTGTNEDRFKDRTYTVDAGVKRRNLQGGEFRLNQRFGQQENNSRFLLPNPQGTTKVEMQYTQPLLNGYGQAVNESRVLLAQIDTQLSQDELVRKLESHLMAVTEAYWELYRVRRNSFSVKSCWKRRSRLLVF